MLYVNKSYSAPGKYDAGSQACMDLVSDREDVTIQDVDSILKQGVDLPQWLTATPCVVDTQTNSALQGSAAVDMLTHLEAAPSVKQEEVPISDRDAPKVTSEMVEALIAERQKADKALVKGSGPQPPVQS